MWTITWGQIDQCPTITKLPLERYLSRNGRSPLHEAPISLEYGEGWINQHYLNFGSIENTTRIHGPSGGNMSVSKSLTIKSFLRKN